MAVLLLYSILDVKAKSYSPPMAHPTDGVAIRVFGQECSNPESMLSKHAEDFSLFRVGVFDTDTGQHGDPEPPEYVSKALDFVPSN